MTDLEIIKSKYAKYGVTAAEVDRLYQSAIDRGFSESVALTGTRLVLSQTYGEHELFSVLEVEEALGITDEEFKRMIEEHGQEWFEQGYITRVSLIPQEEGG